MIVIPVTKELEQKAKEQIDKFEKSEKGNYRYRDVQAWRGIVSEFAVDMWLTELERQGKLKIFQHAKGIDTTGKPDQYDILTDKGAIEVSSSTEIFHTHQMPKKNQIDLKSPDMIMIGARYIPNVEPNKVEIVGFMKISEVKKYPIERNKSSAYYYKVPNAKLEPIENLFQETKTSS